MVNIGEQRSQQPVHKGAQPVIAQLLPVTHNMRRNPAPAQEIICEIFLPPLITLFESAFNREESE
jgi:hypothetical protein